jgi:hypothetical protein
VVLDKGSTELIASVEHGDLAVSAAASIVRESKPATAFRPGHPRRTLADIEALSDIAPGAFDLKPLSPPSERANYKEASLAKPYSETAKKYFAPQEARLARLHQLSSFLRFFRVSDHDKPLVLKGRCLRNRLWCRPSLLRCHWRGASLRHVFALQDSPQGRQGTSRVVGCRKPAGS